MEKTHKPATDKKAIAEQARKACNLPANQNGPDLSKGGKKGETATSDFA